MSKSSPIVRRRIDAVFLFDAVESACNGEPNDGGRPRQDPDTLRLWWNDSALKRFFRNGLLERYQDAKGHRVLVQHGYPLNRCQTEALEANGVDVSDAMHADDDGGEKTRKQKKSKLSEPDKLQARQWIAKEFQDVRWFGCVLDVGYQLGNLTGPLQFGIARGVHPVNIHDGAVTRVTVTTEKDLADVKDRDMGTKYIVPYALFRGRWCYTPAYGEKAGFTVDDLRDFVQILKDPFQSRQSASLGMVTLRKMWIFVHDGFYGNAQRGVLDDLVEVETEAEPPQSLRDFDIRFSQPSVPGIKVFTEEMLDQFVDEIAQNPGKAR